MTDIIRGFDHIAAPAQSRFLRDHRLPHSLYLQCKDVEFMWDAANTRHLGRHKITPQEAEETILLDGLESEFQHHADEEPVLCFGRTATGGAVRVVTGYPMTKSQQRVYLKEN